MIEAISIYVGSAVFWVLAVVSLWKAGSFYRDGIAAKREAERDAKMAREFWDSSAEFLGTANRHLYEAQKKLAEARQLVYQSPQQPWTSGRNLPPTPGVGLFQSSADPGPPEVENEAIYGYKRMAVTSPSPSVVRLTSPVVSHPWNTATEKAICRARQPWKMKTTAEEACEECLERDYRDHHCGIYAAKEVSELLGEMSDLEVIVKVRLWGVVVEAEHGYRATDARIEEVWIPSKASSWINQQERIALVERYPDVKFVEE